MTRGEQIDWLCRLRADINNGVIFTPWNKEFTEALNNVLEQEPKTGKWILIDKELSRYKCSECGEIIKLHKKSEISSFTKDETLSDYPFSHCGARMESCSERSE